MKKILVLAYKARFGKMELEMLIFEWFLMDFDDRYGTLVKEVKKFLGLAYKLWFWERRQDFVVTSKFFSTLQIFIVQQFSKKRTPPRRGIEPRSPAWQAGILTSILSRIKIPLFIKKKRYLTVLYMETELVLKTDLNSLFQFSFSVHCST